MEKLKSTTYLFGLEYIKQEFFYYFFPFWGRHIVFLLSVLHKSLHAQLFQWEFPKTVYASLLPNEDSQIITVIW